MCLFIKICFVYFFSGTILTWNNMYEKYLYIVNKLVTFLKIVFCYF